MKCPRFCFNHLITHSISIPSNRLRCNKNLIIKFVLNLQETFVQHHLNSIIAGFYHILEFAPSKNWGSKTSLKTSWCSLLSAISGNSIINFSAILSDRRHHRIPVNQIIGMLKKIAAFVIDSRLKCSCSSTGQMLSCAPLENFSLEYSQMYIVS